jgi:protein-L-isoaspartate(D-aspartate) O-methyltransferase
MKKIIDELIREGYLKSHHIIRAFSEIDRTDFVPQELKLEAYRNVALPIGYGQTISQPLTVAFMLELLDPRTGQKILDVGSGSGWTTALLSQIVGERGKVIALERVGELMEFGKNNVEKYSFVKKGTAEFHQADGSAGFPERSPFDRILVSAASQNIPEDLKRQMKIRGKMVIPIKNSIFYIERKSEDDFFQEEYPGFSFVPLITTKEE